MSLAQENFGLLCWLLIEPGTVVLSDFLKKQLNKIYPSKTLEDILNLPQVQHDMSLVTAFTVNQQQLLYPQSRGKNNLGSAKKNVKLCHLDISLICILLRNIAGLCPSQWIIWDNPQPHDSSPPANISRIGIFRNLCYDLGTTSAITDEDFSKLWDGIFQSLLQLSTKYSQHDYNTLRSLPIDIDTQIKYKHMLTLWYQTSCATDTAVSYTEEVSIKEHLPTAEECETVMNIQIEKMVERKILHNDDTTEYSVELATCYINDTDTLVRDSKRVPDAADIKTAIMTTESNIQQNLDTRTEQIQHQLHHMETNLSRKVDESSRHESETKSTSREGKILERHVADRLRPRNQDFKGREILLHEIRQKLKVVHRLTVFGLGGVGKTTLVTEYAHLNRDNYHLIRWIDAEDESLLSSLKEFADDLNIQTQGQNVGTIAKQIFKNIMRLSSWLLIFDNTTDYKSLTSVLPTTDSFHDTHHILITSRNTNWKNFVSLDTFTECEAIMFIKQICGGKCQTQDCKNLAKTIDLFPLALGHATQYIKQNCISIQSYLKIFNQSNKAKLLSTGFQLEDDYQITVMNTWTTTEQRITEKSADAIQLLQWCAYLFPDNIPLKFFESLLPVLSKLQINKAVHMLLSYSMIAPSSESDCIKIHRLVQFFVRHKISTHSPDSVKEILIPLMNMLADGISTYPSTPELASKTRSYLLHIRVLFSYIAEGLLLELFDIAERLMINTLHRLGDVYQPHDVLVIGERLLKLQQIEYDTNHVNLKNTQLQMALSKQSTGDAEGAIKLYENILDKTMRHYGNESVEAAEVRRLLADAFRLSGKKHEAVDMHRNCMPVIEQNYRSDSIEVAEAKRTMATAQMKAGDPRGALLIYRDIMPVYEKTKNTVEVAELQILTGATLRLLGDDQGASDLFEQAILFGEKHYGSENPKVAKWQELLAVCMDELGNSQYAYESYKKILPIHEAHFGENHWRVAYAKINMTTSLNSLGDPGGAIRLVQQAQLSIENKSGSEHLGMARAHETIAQALLQQGHPEDALPLLNKSIAIKEKKLQPKHVDVAKTLYKLSVCLESMNRHQEARAKLQRACSICEQNNCESHFPIMAKIKTLRERLCTDDK